MKPTELLMQCLEDFGQDEPVHCVVVYTTESGAVALRANAIGRTTVVGMLEYGKYIALGEHNQE